MGVSRWLRETLMGGLEWLVRVLVWLLECLTEDL